MGEIVQQGSVQAGTPFVKRQGACLSWPAILKYVANRWSSFSAKANSTEQQSYPGQHPTALPTPQRHPNQGR
ncbi:hypothetical protein BZL29_8445 [Mycobacterium kansasii]|uniref:Uncharacterized protein n=1 Tax=Mycobacterium kansasii TaxID=1768 RepID=A0A1V3W9U1_MYCKA|nr:hypothetical protein BZL29_8445 [Mycobacterium kansasii]